MGDDESDNILTDMGAACFYPDTNISISTRLDLWPSSTRVELVAILLALLGVPADTTLHIHSDSQAAIWTIEKMSEGLLSVRKLLKSVNNLLLIKIMTVIREKHINVKFMKVKAHMGIAENEIADCLAKQAISEGIHQFNNNFISLDGIFNYFLAYEQHPIERNLRQFVKIIFSAYNAEECAQLHAFRDRIAAKDTSWHTSWILFKNLRGFNCNSMKKQSLWTFAAKLLTKTLLLGFTLKLRHKSLYNNFVCSACSRQEEETWNHFTTCGGCITLWGTIYQDTKVALITEAQNHRLVEQIIGRSEASTEFNYFKSFATEAKFPHLTFSRLQLISLLTDHPVNFYFLTCDM
jgi:ribonuclease HI